MWSKSAYVYVEFGDTFCVLTFVAMTPHFLVLFDVQRTKNLNELPVRIATGVSAILLYDRQKQQHQQQQQQIVQQYRFATVTAAAGATIPATTTR
jgi:hypothetical protein